MAWVYLFFAILMEVIGTTALKASDGFTKLAPTGVVTVSYAASFYLLALALREIPVGPAYAIWSGMGIVVISIIGWIVYKQVLDTPALIGMGMILGGVVIIQVFSGAGH
ncbi:multidrug efflux SMR transporter [Nereida sp. MMG025]|uniref:DMT family transporter n=1 Tax=Nereida sp. MMG025 TaxID=2909981 RepID=UPI001F1C7095|nr:multidrug efflux SMR transporter [Nereida sp. MMG025]MCF6444065.1 multidrug efflux SMR transporter [Nereida sp. MMG025]